jgi:thioredoxin-dependent peroxiredoxin
MRSLSLTLLGAAFCAGLYAQPAPPVKTHLKVGDAAPNFTLPATTGGRVTLADFKGKSNVVLAFFPAAFTGGWTKEMIAYQAGMAKFDAAETKVFGVSTDNTPSQREFATKNNVAFPILSDFAKREVAKAYGVLQESGVANRATFVVNKEGKIAYIEEGSSAIDPTAAAEACSRANHK